MKATIFTYPGKNTEVKNKTKQTFVVTNTSREGI